MKCQARLSIWQNAEDRYEDNIMELIEDGEHFMTMQIKVMEYNLSRMLEVLENFFFENTRDCEAQDRNQE